MNNAESSRQQLIWGYVARFVQISSGILLLPLVLKKLPESELGIYYVYLSINMFIYQLTIGVYPALVRNISYVFSGAKEINKIGISEFNDNSNSIDYHLLKKVIITGKYFFALVTVVAFVFVGIGGSVYMYNIIGDSNNIDIIFSSWVIYTTSTLLEVYFYYYTPILLGSGYIKKSYQITSFSKLIFLVFAIICFYLNLGLLSIAIGRIFGVISNIIISRYYINRMDFQAKISTYIISINDSIECFKKIIYSSLRQGIVSISEYTINNSVILLMPFLFTIEQTAQFGLLNQLYTLIITLSLVPLVTQSPKIAKLWMRKDVISLENNFKHNLIAMYFLIIVGTVVIIVLGEFMLNIIDSRTDIPSNNFIMIFAFSILLQYTYMFSYRYLVLKNIVPHYKIMLLTAIVFGILFYFLGGTNLKMWAIPITIFITSITYNLWKWPTMFFNELKK